MRSSPLFLGLFLSFSLSALLGAGCFGDDETPTRGDGGSLPIFPDGGMLGDADPMENCPPSPPKDGENCPAVTENRLTCTFVVGVCQHGGATYDVTVDYCCGRGQQWTLCGANTTPCETAGDAGAD